MLVPSAMKQLDERNASFGEPSCNQAIVGESSFFQGVFSIEIEHMLGFVPEIDQFGHAGLHAVGHLILGDAGAGFGVADLFKGAFVECLQPVERCAADVTGD